MRGASRIQGLMLCLGAVLAACFLLWGIINKSYWALAIPVVIGSMWLLGLGFWIGWNIFTIRVEEGPKEK